MTATLREAIARVNALATPPSFVLHTGDLTQLSKPEEFDTLAESLKSLKTDHIFYVPGEHDVLNDNGEAFHERFGKGTQGDGWYSFDQKGVHFIGLVNVLNLKAGGSGLSRPRSARVARERCIRIKEQHTDRCLRAHSSLVGLSPMGLGNRR